MPVLTDRETRTHRAGPSEWRVKNGLTKMMANITVTILAVRRG